MCTAMALLGTAMSAAGQVMAANAQNAAAEQNAVNANVAAGHKYAEEGRQLTQEARRANVEAYDKVMQARRAKGTALASTGSAGLDLSSASVNAIISGMNNDAALSEMNYQDNVENMKAGYIGRTKGAYHEARGRVASVPKANPGNLAIGIASSGLNAAASTTQGKNWLGLSVY